MSSKNLSERHGAYVFGIKLRWLGSVVILVINQLISPNLKNCKNFFKNCRVTSLAAMCVNLQTCSKMKYVVINARQKKNKIRRTNRHTFSMKNPKKLPWHICFIPYAISLLFGECGLGIFMSLPGHQLPRNHPIIPFLRFNKGLHLIIHIVFWICFLLYIGCILLQPIYLAKILYEMTFDICIWNDVCILKANYYISVFL